MGHIYKITNLVNNKIYIGKTINSYKRRFSSHKYEAKKYGGKNSYLHRAMLKYGFENFIIESIFESDNDTILVQKEEFYIKKFKSYKRAIGYNLLKSGSRYNSKRVNHDITIYSSDNGKKSKGRKRSGKYVGVNKNGNGWQSTITRNNKTYNLGIFDIEEDAAKAYDIKSLELDKKEAILNFPNLKSQYIQGKIIVNPRPKQQTGAIRIYKQKNGKWRVRCYILNREISRLFSTKEDAIKASKEWEKKPPNKHEKQDVTWTKNKKPKNSISKFLGVSFNKRYKKWQASVFYNKKNNWIGYFESEIEAAKARDNFVIKNNIDLILNFNY